MLYIFVNYIYYIVILESCELNNSPYLLIIQNFIIISVYKYSYHIIIMYLIINEFHKYSYLIIIMYLIINEFIN